MNGSEVEKCPKCGGEMEPGKTYGYWWVSKRKARLGFFAFQKPRCLICRKCGYVELYTGP